MRSAEGPVRDDDIMNEQPLRLKLRRESLSDAAAAQPVRFAARSNRSRCITLVQAWTKSRTNLSWPSEAP